ncbi:hypothetical protein B0T40_09635 [Chromobacterium haemolyticum]|uniref:hypothetical protein n=1 Tax=Chromobacterium haemolyticum TaxID=394935 RepID=UPI0009DA2BDA|nr:hypothetical protein [Chromobacterium haemolyticum]OQS36647.1 hypothetical protein B0T40_09635 [Chromobacterium haemolyticum]
MTKYYLPPLQKKKPRISECKKLPSNSRVLSRVPFFRTWEDAHAALLERARKRVALHERELSEARQLLAAVETMKKGS